VSKLLDCLRREASHLAATWVNISSPLTATLNIAPASDFSSKFKSANRLHLRSGPGPGSAPRKTNARSSKAKCASSLPSFGMLCEVTTGRRSEHFVHLGAQHISRTALHREGDWASHSRPRRCWPMGRLEDATRFVGLLRHGGKRGQNGRKIKSSPASSD
jgi:hypothetical protein